MYKMHMYCLRCRDAYLLPPIAVRSCMHIANAELMIGSAESKETLGTMSSEQTVRRYCYE